MIIDLVLNNDAACGFFDNGLIVDDGKVYALYLMEEAAVEGGIYGFAAFAEELVLKADGDMSKFPFFTWVVEDGKFCILPSGLPIEEVILHNYSDHDFAIEDSSGSEITSLGVIKSGDVKNIHPAYTKHFFKRFGFIEEKSKVDYEIWLGGGQRNGYFKRGIRREGPREEKVFSALDVVFGDSEHPGVPYGALLVPQNSSTTDTAFLITLSWASKTPRTITFLPTSEQIESITLHNECPFAISLFDNSQHPEPPIRAGIIHPGKTKTVKLNTIMSVREGANALYTTAVKHGIAEEAAPAPKTVNKVAVKGTSAFRVNYKTDTRRKNSNGTQN